MLATNHSPRGGAVNSINNSRLDAVAASRRPSAPPLTDAIDSAIDSIAMKDHALAAAHATRAVPMRAVVRRVVVVDLVPLQVEVEGGHVEVDEQA